MALADTDHTPITEPVYTGDTFATELVKAEEIGPCIRLTFAALQSIDGGRERVVVAKLVLPPEVVKRLPIDLAALIAAGNESNVVPMLRASLN